ncbi:helix-turn-helix domain-containing protein [Nibricoccus sp. IMCC34717]|uniref:helix-turn-helix domain-containing protein n=1 Tax=Nibricoccus sp. IMCC34717 TaxID=3034021 RepID=UPI00384C92D6
MTRHTKDTPNEVIRQRLAALELAATLGSVTEACRQSGISRTQFYEYKRRFEAQGVDGLRDLPPIAKQHPAATPAAVISRIMELSMVNPTWGCVKLSEQLAREGSRVSGPTVQKILNQRGLGTTEDRLGKLEELAMGGDLDLSDDQVRAIERMNPAFRERHQDSNQPGQLLVQDTCSVGEVPGIGPVYAQLVIDTFNGFSFGYLHQEKLPEHAAGILHHEVMPQYVQWGMRIQEIITDHGREYCGQITHPYELFLQLNDIRHRVADAPRTLTNGFVERFHRAAMDEFFRPLRQDGIPLALERLQDLFRDWIEKYNHERPLLGFPTMGRAPADTLPPFAVLPGGASE